MESFTLVITVLFITSFVSIGILYLWSIIWGYKDAESRGKPGFAVAALIALFTWPIGLLFWTIIRPERNISNKTKTSSSKILINESIIIKSFKEMPFLLKLLTVLSIYSLFTIFIDFIQMKPISFAYFNTGFPKNYPVIWYIYQAGFKIITLLIYFKRSYSALITLLKVTIGFLIITLFYSIYSISNLPEQQKIPVLFVLIFTYFFGGLIFVYLYNQKKYFNKP